MRQNSYFSGSHIQPRHTRQHVGLEPENQEARILNEPAPTSWSQELQVQPTPDVVRGRLCTGAQLALRSSTRSPCSVEARKKSDGQCLLQNTGEVKETLCLGKPMLWVRKSLPTEHFLCLASQTGTSVSGNCVCQVRRQTEGKGSIKAKSWDWTGVCSENVYYGVSV